MKALYCIKSPSGELLFDTIAELTYGPLNNCEQDPCWENYIIRIDGKTFEQQRAELKHLGYSCTKVRLVEDKEPGFTLLDSEGNSWVVLSTWQEGDIFVADCKRWESPFWVFEVFEYNPRQPLIGQPETLRSRKNPTKTGTLFLKE